MGKLWKMRVQKNYGSLDELIHCDSAYNIAKRCGYNSCEKLWEDNPMLQGSTNPSDFGLVKDKTISVKLTEKQIKQLASILSVLNGRLQWRGANGKPTKRLANSWRQGRAIEKAVAHAIGMQAYSYVTDMVADLTHSENKS